MIGALWNGQDSPPGDDERRATTSGRSTRATGSILTFDDTDGQERLRLETPGGQIVTLADGPGHDHDRGRQRQHGHARLGGVTVQCVGQGHGQRQHGGGHAPSQVTVNAGMSKFSGVVQADTVITNRS